MDPGDPRPTEEYRRRHRPGLEALPPSQGLGRVITRSEAPPPVAYIHYVPQLSPTTLSIHGASAGTAARNPRAGAVRWIIDLLYSSHRFPMF